ncbi:GMC family oxidoreductase [Rhizobium halophytocola]|uniref:Gluconate 2-dehydrogenase alpha chain n=1 Tax=Rhizobium halophytocola TaxID=735519 RepID=A0ABS4DTW4_9HYPH|nr:GMC family oxidoreductase [Rhizobium halophytocola]MBP1849138.1 gluconate 2-dehydrogenase alpha chain [Rhizobium halophytocola]
MTKILPHKDVVIIGLGWSGSIIANELTDEGLDVVAIERGPWRDTGTDFNIGYIQDELRYAIRRDLFLQPRVEAMTMRNNDGQSALPIREYNSFLPGNGVGGAGVHWNGQTWRFWDSDFQINKHLTERYGAQKFDGLTLQDWGVTAQEMEKSYDKFEYLAGISGKAGNVNGQIQEGGNPFEDPRSRDYPLPPMEMTYGPTKFAEVTKGMGLHPFPCPSGNLSKDYVNPLGVAMGQCTMCGFCERFGCANYSKSSAQTTVLPVLMKKKNFEARTLCEVLHIDKDASGKMAKGVTYVDSSDEVCFQPADLVVVTAYALHNARLMMLSGIGQVYDPNTGEGTIGRNYCYQTNAGARVYFDDENFNPFIAAGALGMTCDDYNGDAFDHSDVDFVGGAGINCVPSSGRPIQSRPTPPGTPAWGKDWKKATAETYKSSLAFGSQGSSYPVAGNHLDLDPTYKDRFGRPLLRITFDFPDNDLRMSHFVSDRMEDIAKAMGGREHTVSRAKKGWNSAVYQSTHNTGGVIMGTDPKKSALNKYLQSWEAHNVFVVGASAFAHNAGKNPTGTVGGLAFWAADAIRNQYLRNPGVGLVSA